MSKFIFLLTFLALAFSLEADDVTTLKVWHCDGTVSSYSLSESSQVSFRQAEMCYSDGDWSINIPLAEIKMWTYDTSTARIENISNNPSEIHITQIHDRILISGLGWKDMVRVYSTEGRTVHEASSLSKQLIINTSTWTSGVYIVTVRNTTHKIIKR